MEATLAAAPARTPLRATALLADAAMKVRRGNLNGGGRELAVEATAIMREVADPQTLAQTLHLAGLLAWVEDGAWQHAVHLVEEATPWPLRSGRPVWWQAPPHMLGVIGLLRNGGQDAEPYLSETLDLLGRLPADQAPFFSAVTPGWFWELGPGGQPRMPFTETVLLYRLYATKRGERPRSLAVR